MARLLSGWPGYRAGVEYTGSRWAHLPGARVHWVDFGGPDAPEALVVCVHGLGGAAVSWEGLAPLLTDRYRVLAPDLVGFGLTEPRGARADLGSNDALLTAYLSLVTAEHPGLPLVLVGHSMGGLLAARRAGAGAPTARRAGAEQPTTPVALALLDPALPDPHGHTRPLVRAFSRLYGLPLVARGIGRLRRRLRDPDQQLEDMLRLCCPDPSRVPEQLRERHRELMHVRGSRAAVLDPLYDEAARAVITLLADGDLARATYERVPEDLPVLLVHGTLDRLVPYAAAMDAAHRHPAWTFVTGEDLGHLPQVEDPAWTGRTLRPWLDGVIG